MTHILEKHQNLWRVCTFCTRDICIAELISVLSLKSKFPSLLSFHISSLLNRPTWNITSHRPCLHRLKIFPCHTSGPLNSTASLTLSMFWTDLNQGGLKISLSPCWQYFLFSALPWLNLQNDKIATKQNFTFQWTSDNHMFTSLHNKIKKLTVKWHYVIFRCPFKCEMHFLPIGFYGINATFRSVGLHSMETFMHPYDVELDVELRPNQRQIDVQSMLNKHT